MHILAADIGGTNSRFGFFAIQEGQEPVLEGGVRIPTASVSSWDDMVACLRETELQPCLQDADCIVLAAAGPVRAGRSCQLTNADWGIDLEQSSAVPAHKTVIINDFVAQAMGCLSAYAMQSAVCLQAGVANSGVLGVLGAGTGLGHCALIPDSSGHFIPLASEGGHAPFGFVNDEEMALMRFVLARTGLPFVFGDTVLSGSGLSLVHEFVTGQRCTPAEVAASIGPDSETTAWFARFYGRAAKAYALYVLAEGGICITGGLAARNPFLVTHAHFLAEFTNCPDYQILMHDIPVRLITAMDVGLYGAAYYGIGCLRRTCGRSAANLGLT